MVTALVMGMVERVAMARVMREGGLPFMRRAGAGAAGTPKLAHAPAPGPAGGAGGGNDMTGY
jgi:hypothetical protein